MAIKYTTRSVEKGWAVLLPLYKTSKSIITRLRENFPHGKQIAVTEDSLAKKEYRLIKLFTFR